MQTIIYSLPLIAFFFFVIIIWLDILSDAKKMDKKRLEMKDQEKYFRSLSDEEIKEITQELRFEYDEKLRDKRMAAIDEIQRRKDFDA